MLKRLLLLPVLIIPFIIHSCKNDLDLLDEYEEKIVCFAVLNPDDTMHYVRVSKVFLGEGNALQFAQVQDSIQLRPENMEVRITRLQNNVEMQYWILTPDTSIPREEGIFLYPQQVIYRGAFPLLTDGSEYKLTVTDLVSGYVTTSTTTVVRDVVHTSPTVFQFMNFEDEGSISFKFNSSLHGRRYQLKLRFWYDEQFIYDTTQVSYRYVDWYLGETDSYSVQGGEQMTVSVQRRNFLNMLVNQVEVNPLVRRVSRRVDFYYTAAHDDLVTYIKVQQANAGSAQELPEFTNMENGLGLFTTRNTTIFTNFHIDQDTQYALTTEQMLDDLNFVR
jgi:hypothetical protein